MSSGSCSAKSSKEDTTKGKQASGRPSAPKGSDKENKRPANSAIRIRIEDSPISATTRKLESLHVSVPDSPTSELEKYFKSLSGISSVEDRASASIADYADSSMRSMHNSSECYTPSLQMLTDSQPAADRRETLDWLVQAFGVMHFSDVALFDAALVLDRHSACTLPGPISSDISQRNLLAAVCLALKLGSREDAQLSLRQVVEHLGRSRIPFLEVLNAEVALLRKLGFCVGTPTANCFLEALSLRIPKYDARFGSLASFLLQLSLVEPHLHYGYPHCILAAATLAIGLSVTDAPAEAYGILREDLALCGSHVEDSLMSCCLDVHALWVRAAGRRDAQIMGFYDHLSAKFAQPAYHNASYLTPPMPLPPMPLLLTGLLGPSRK